ncbi:MAG TPA: YeeE/YedE family protein [Microscillaceae bacterium]|nr:YeeE/YedE family protein [Microscillaceae bacterium]
MLDLIKQPWPWYLAGPLIALVAILLLFFGKSFGVSATLRTSCSILGAGKRTRFFDYNWKKDRWNLLFVLGAIVGGLLTSQLLMHPEITISQNTVQDLQAIGLQDTTSGFLPNDLFSIGSIFSIRGFVVFVVGGFLIGFGARYAGGCTSGHAISGLSNLQIPSLIAVIGFFIGGLLMTHFLLPYIIQL